MPLDRRLCASRNQGRARPGRLGAAQLEVAPHLRIASHLPHAAVDEVVREVDRPGKVHRHVERARAQKRGRAEEAEQELSPGAHEQENRGIRDEAVGL
jgi:hypothetical protein